MCSTTLQPTTLGGQARRKSARKRARTTAPYVAVRHHGEPLQRRWRSSGLRSLIVVQQSSALRYLAEAEAAPRLLRTAATPVGLLRGGTLSAKYGSRRRLRSITHGSLAANSSFKGARRRPHRQRPRLGGFGESRAENLSRQLRLS
jgi:hypothetical protein